MSDTYRTSRRPPPDQAAGSAERPILFSGSMVRAILSGQKTQTRRVIKPQPMELDCDDWGWGFEDQLFAADDELREHLFHEVYGTKGTPYGSVGGRLWVRETWRLIVSGRKAGGCEYRADDPGASGIGFLPWRPSIFMPREQSRITLEITDVRVQRLKDITVPDIKAEGVIPKTLPYEAAIAEWTRTWDAINAQRGFGWSVNPWVWALTFRRVEA